MGPSEQQKLQSAVLVSSISVGISCLLPYVTFIDTYIPYFQTVIPLLYVQIFTFSYYVQVCMVPTLVRSLHKPFHGLFQCYPIIFNTFQC